MYVYDIPLLVLCRNIMARNRKRKTGREIISHDAMKEAVRLVRNGTSLRKVAKDKCVSKSALQRYVTKAKNTPL